jgi:uncharacterized protein
MGRQWLGSDFRAALSGSLYDARNGQGWPWAIFFAVLQVGIYMLLQAFASVLVHVMLFGGLPDMSAGPLVATASLAKAALVGMLPVSVLMALVSWWFAGLANKTGERGLPLRLPNLGSLGWPIVVGASLVAIYLLFFLAFWVLGIDPETYMPTKDGISDLQSSSGLVEKTMADLADEPLLFALALPGIFIGAPLVEEFMFRGALFTAIRQTWFGKTGAVVISAAAWALIHASSAPWLFVAVIFLMGLLLGGLLLRFGSLWVTIAVHAAWNLTTSFTIFGSVGGT